MAIKKGGAAKMSEFTRAAASGSVHFAALFDYSANANSNSE